MAKSALAFKEEILYPESDGEPMAETDDHRDELAEIIFTLKRFFRDRPDVYVSGNLFVYYEEGDPQKNRAPDVFVVFGVDNHQRRNYRLWEEGQAPVVAIELTSKSTKREDQEVKPEIYAQWGVGYLFHYDVLGEYQSSPLKGHRLGEDGGHRQYHPLVGPPKGPLPCPPLGLDLWVDGDGRLQFLDRATGKMLLRERVALDLTLEALRHTEQALEQEMGVRRKEAEARRQAEHRTQEQVEARRRAEQRAQEQTDARRQAEQRVQEQTDARRQAEQRAREQVEARRQAEQWAQEQTDARRQAEQLAREQAEARRKAEQRTVEQAEALRKAAAEKKEMMAVIERLRAQVPLPGGKLAE